MHFSLVASAGHLYTLELIRSFVAPLNLTHELVLVDDGSPDETWEELVLVPVAGLVVLHWAWAVWRARRESPSLGLPSWNRFHGPHPLYNEGYRFAVQLDRHTKLGATCTSEHQVLIGRFTNPQRCRWWSSFMIDCKKSPNEAAPVSAFSLEPRGMSLQAWLNGPFGDARIMRENAELEALLR